MVAKEWIETFKPGCDFYLEDGHTVCKAPAVGVYVTADHLSHGKFVCDRHATEAERDGDGPVFREYGR